MREGKKHTHTKKKPKKVGGVEMNSLSASRNSHPEVSAAKGTTSAHQAGLPQPQPLTERVLLVKGPASLN